MFRLIGLVLSIGLADSLNPTTIAPALYLATGEHPRARVTEFTLGVFAVYLVGGAAIALGPGQLLLALVPKPNHHTRYLIELIAGIALLVSAALLWHNRARLAERKMPDVSTKGRSSAILGATITAVELPTAFPYFAAIAAIVGSGLGPTRQVLLLVLFNLCFVLPLLAIVATLTFARHGAAPILAKGRDFLEARWPVVVAVLLLLAGVFVVLLGVTGLEGHRHGRVGGFMRQLRHLLVP